MYKSVAVLANYCSHEFRFVETRKWEMNGWVVYSVTLRARQLNGVTVEHDRYIHDDVGGVMRCDEVFCSPKRKHISETPHEVADATLRGFATRTSLWSVHRPGVLSI